MDWELIDRLLNVMDGIRGLPKLKPIHDMAELTLLDLVADAQKNLDERKEKETAEKAEADAKAQADLEAQRQAEGEEEPVRTSTFKPAAEAKRRA